MIREIIAVLIFYLLMGVASFWFIREVGYCRDQGATIEQCLMAQ